MPSETDLSRAEVLVLDACAEIQTSSGTWASWKRLVEGEIAAESLPGCTGSGARVRQASAGKFG